MRLHQKTNLVGMGVGTLGLLAWVAMCLSPVAVDAAIITPFVGSWRNFDLGTNGSASASVTMTPATSINLSIVIKGNVFGDPEPDGGRAPLNLTGMFNPDGSVNFSPVSHPTLGDLNNATLDAAGNFTGSLLNVPNSSIDEVILTGIVARNAIDLNFLVKYSGMSSATGLIKLDAIPEPGTAILLVAGGLWVVSRRRRASI